MIRRFIALAFITIAVIGISCAADYAHEKASIKGSGFKGKEMNLTEFKAYSYKSYTPPIESQNVNNGYTIALYSIPNEDHPYIIILGGKNSQPEAVNGVLQVVTQPRNTEKNENIMKYIHWFNWYGLFKSWWINVSEEDFASDNAYGLHYTLNLTKDDLLWNESGSSLSLKFYPENFSIDSTHYSFDINPDNTISLRTGSGWGKNTGYRSLPEEVTQEEFLKAKERVKAGETLLSLPSNPGDYLGSIQYPARVQYAQIENNTYNSTELKKYNLPPGLVILNNDPNANYEVLRGGSMLILNSSQITVIYNGDVRYDGPLENASLGLDAFGPYMIPVVVSTTWSQITGQPVSKAESKKVEKDYFNAVPHKSIITSEELNALPTSPNETKQDYFNGMSRIFFGPQTPQLMLGRSDRTTGGYSGGLINYTYSKGVMLNKSLGLSLDMIADEYGIPKEGGVRDLRKYMLPEPRIT